ncbi:MAG: DNA polymerase II [Candidatus Latescibacterota bacterium]|nr:DNA polymerase II [Candidatus Latescibacterota bacterium]
MTSDSSNGYLLHLFHRDGNAFTIFGVGRLENGETFGLVDTRYLPTFYIRMSDADRFRRVAGDSAVSISDSEHQTMDGEPVISVSATRVGTLRRASDRASEQEIRTYEADFSPARQYAIHRQIRGAIRVEGEYKPGNGVDRIYTDPAITPTEHVPELGVLSLDIETTAEADRVLSVSLVPFGTIDSADRVLLVGDPQTSDPEGVSCLPTQTALLESLAEQIHELNPDVITGWNVIDFDLPVLQNRAKALGVPFTLGRTRDEAWHRTGQSWGGSRMVLPGRQVIDAMRIVRAIPRRFDDYKLDTISHEILGRGKTLDVPDQETGPEAIMKAYVEDRAAFCKYVLEDSRLVRDILSQEGLIDLTLRRSLLTGLPLDGAWGSIAAFDTLYTSELHRQGCVAPTLGVDRVGQGESPGGLVFAPDLGVFKHVFVFDFKSLYPSIIRTFNIDPQSNIATHRKTPDGKEADWIKAPNGAAFSREPGILPFLIETFHQSREQAKHDGDELASFTYKIVMNSFYGVLATSSCRYASSNLAGAITEFGHHFLRWTKRKLEEKGHRVLYGDTDSVFIEAGLPDDAEEEVARQVGRDLCEALNNEIAEYVSENWFVTSKLELEFEKYYSRFFLPPMRGSEDRARAKGYAGLRKDDGIERVEIVGMEAVRRDWTNLAHDLQRELLDMMFRDADASVIERKLVECVDLVRSGKKDADLVYRKGLRKSVDSYTKSIPSHVKAARLLPKPRGVINYVITHRGPQPVGYVTAPLDYEHYIEKQIKPIAGIIAQVCRIDVAAAISREPDLFVGIKS